MADIGIQSSSKITTYMGCSMAYFLKYVKHEKVPSHVRFAVGKSIHYMIERFYKYNYKSADSFANFWKFYWFRQCSGEGLKGKAKAETVISPYETKKGIIHLGDHINLGQNVPGADPVGIFFGYMKLGANILKRFYENHIAEKRGENGRRPPAYNEFGFGNRKAEPFEINGHKVRGFIDRIDNTLGGWFLGDYKTDKGDPMSDSFTLHRHPQFTFYSYAFRKLFGAIEKAIFYYHLRTGRIFETHRSEKDYDYAKRLLDETAEGVSKNRFFPFYGFHCNICDLKIACEKWCMEEHGGPSLNLEGRLKPAVTFDDWDAALNGRARFLEMQAERN